MQYFLENTSRKMQYREKKKAKEKVAVDTTRTAT